MSHLTNNAPRCNNQPLRVHFQDLTVNESVSIDVSSSIVNGSDNSANCEVSSGTIEGEKMISSLIVEGDKDEGVESEYSSLSCVSFCDSVDANEASFRSSLHSKPHKSNDIRWDAIQCVKAKDGELGLGHFRLLKKLGFGDIGSVYLAELRKLGCLFAMKVMDKAMLEGRKKLMRAQTERDILGLLDHPFLPTLYSHFETEKFSCLLMEFCSGGDLHILRQRQPGKHFSEQAARLVHTYIVLDSILSIIHSFVFCVSLV